MNAPVALADLAEAAIRNCLGNTTLVAGSGETAEVARLVLQLPEELVSAWRQELTAGELDIIGVFCHKTPRARFNDTIAHWSGEPELCDLMLVVDSEDSGVRDRRALLIQAKLPSGAASGQFLIETGTPEKQRYLYTNWPQFELTGLGRPLPPIFQIAPKPIGSCLGSRYACVDVSTPAPASGWLIEDAQAQVPNDGNYYGVQQATLPLGEALRRMLAGTLGAPLTSGSEWERLEKHLLAVAEHRSAAGKGPSDVKATASGTLLPHVAAASLFIRNSHVFFDSKATAGYRLSGAHEIGGNSPPIDSERPRLIHEEEFFGYGVIYIRVVSPEWRLGE